MKNDITKVVKECEIFQRNKSENVPSPGLLQSMPVPENVWETISVDFIEGLPKSKGNDTILVVVDRLTKYYHLITITHSFAAQKVEHEILNKVVKLHGVPQAIIFKK